MKKLKKRIKRALAAFLREELLEFIGYNHNIPYMSLNDRFNVQNLPFETVVMEQAIALAPNSVNRYAQHPAGLEGDIEDAKRRFAEKVMEHIHVEAQDLIDPKYFMRRSVRLVLRVQGKKH